MRDIKFSLIMWNNTDKNKSHTNTILDAIWQIDTIWQTLVIRWLKPIGISILTKST